MNANQYAVTFGYKAQDGYYYGPNGIVGKYHRGNDRPTPWSERNGGTPIVIGNTTIGLTGATGLVSGPHLHTQACTAGSNYANDLDPSPFEFKFGTVVGAGWHSQFGNHIVIRTNGVDLTYAHLSKINVSIGQVISAPVQQGVSTVFENDQQIQDMYYLLRGKNATAEEVAGWRGKPIIQFAQNQYAKKEVVNRESYKTSLETQLTQVRSALQAEQAKPPREVVKEVEKVVEKIVEVPVEKIVPVEVVKEVEPSWLTKVRDFINKFLKKG